ncbi:hypothetical protein ABZ446_40250 [Streptomyces sp. NPDC005813]|uniref:hypothetical protein n=1 Tax=Streptomyces sp. NPDC005813 TaxID=3155592 RepID=UPI00340C2595
MLTTRRRAAAALAALALTGTLAAGSAAGQSNTDSTPQSPVSVQPRPSDSNCPGPGASDDDRDTWGPGMMGSDCWWGPGMMGGPYWVRGDGMPVKSLDQARRHADAFADRLGLRVGEVMQFSRNFYAELETPTGKQATEILVDPADGDTGIEYGPAMMWNTDYGMHPRGQTQNRISPDRAQDLAQRWLSNQGSHLTTGEPEAFPGYYTLHTLRSGKIDGMLSVNASTGAVWDHTWHGTYIATSEH